MFRFRVRLVTVLGYLGASSNRTSGVRGHYGERGAVEGVDVAVEETIIRTLSKPLPHGRKFVWYPDLNMCAFSPCSCPEEFEQVINEARDEWRRHHVRIVPA